MPDQFTFHLFIVIMETFWILPQEFPILVIQGLQIKVKLYCNAGQLQHTSFLSVCIFV